MGVKSQYKILIMLRLFVLSALVACAFSLGGWSEVDSNDDYVRNIVDFYFSARDGGRNAAFLNLKSVQTQIVAGRNFKLTFYIGKSLIECEAIVFEKRFGRRSTRKIIRDTC